MAKAYRKRALGRGLSAILSDEDNNRFTKSASLNFDEIEIDLIDLNPYQPRTNFNQKDIDELASSIKELGLIQPITIKTKDNRYELISGERRLRAFKILKLNRKRRFGNEQIKFTFLKFSSFDKKQIQNMYERDINCENIKESEIEDEIKFLKIKVPIFKILFKVVLKSLSSTFEFIEKFIKLRAIR